MADARAQMDVNVFGLARAGPAGVSTCTAVGTIGILVRERR